MCVCVLLLKGFYSVYRELFKTILEDEQIVRKLPTDKDVPMFGEPASG